MKIFKLFQFNVESNCSRKCQRLKFSFHRIQNWRHFFDDTCPARNLHVIFTGLSRLKLTLVIIPYQICKEVKMIGWLTIWKIFPVRQILWYTLHYEYLFISNDFKKWNLCWGYSSELAALKKYRPLFILNWKNVCDNQWGLNIICWWLWIKIISIKHDFIWAPSRNQFPTTLTYANLRAKSQFLRKGELWKK